jgi:asparagine synthase (glutamine-hydrolysing)
MVAVSGARIEVNLPYALSQKNNHGVSEGMGLWTIGLLFPEFRRSPKWTTIGRRVLEGLGEELIYEDGAFSQHSTNYHRLMLHDYLWALRLGDLNEQPLCAELRARVDRAASFLYQIEDPDTGQVPCLGQNDGSLILPLSHCDYRDHRPVTQAGRFLGHGERCHPDGPWDEDLLWLFGPEALEARVVPPERRDLTGHGGGWYTVRSVASFALVHCATFRHRPLHADQLHVDIWWRGRNLALDAGTYSYNAPPPWDGGLANTAYHNTVTVDDQDQMERASRFLWLPWAKGRSDGFHESPGGQIRCWQGEHDGYERLTPPVRHRRALVRLGDEHWIVVDRLDSSGKHRYCLHWLLADAPYEWDETTGRLVLDIAGGSYQVQVGTLSGTRACSLVRADEHSPRGWSSPYYLAREPALSLDLTAQGNVLTAWTVLGPGPHAVEATPSAIHLRAGDWEGVVGLAADDRTRSLVESASISGRDEDRLEPRSPGQPSGHG